MSQFDELAEINESLRTVVRRAYDLGRRDALKRVAGVLNEETACDERLALMAPDHLDHAHEHSVNGTGDATPSSPPWWAWRVR